jgi:parallel beta-helix repeat protein
MNVLRRGLVASALAWLLVGSPARGANCGDTTGGGGTNVDCSCGDSVTTNTTLTAADPVTTTLCPGRGLNVSTGVTLKLGGRTIQATSGNGEFGVALSSNVTLQGPGKVIGFGFVGIAPFTGTSGQKILSVQARGNGLDGIVIFGDGVARNNVSLSNGRAGILSLPGTGGTLYSNVTRLNGEDGIVLLGVSGVTVQKNISTENARNGIKLQNGTNGNVLDGNELYYNHQNGILLFNGAAGNALTANKAESNTLDGIHVEGNDNNLTLNTGKISGGDGIEVIGSGNHLRDNHGDQNGADGLIAIPNGGANFDDGKNTGNGNGGPAQCQIDGVTCKL